MLLNTRSSASPSFSLFLTYSAKMWSFDLGLSRKLSNSFRVMDFLFLVPNINIILRRGKITINYRMHSLPGNKHNICLYWVFVKTLNLNIGQKNIEFTCWLVELEHRSEYNVRVRILCSTFRQVLWCCGFWHLKNEQNWPLIFKMIFYWHTVGLFSSFQNMTDTPCSTYPLKDILNKIIPGGGG